MEQVYLTDEEFKALPTYAKDQPVPADSPPWKTTDGGPWLLCRWGPGVRVEAAQITIVTIAERVRLAVEADRKARETVALDVTQQTALREIAPRLMGELMGGFIKRRSLNDRAQTRQRMKALLDLMSVDTEYPEVPALNPDQDTLPRGRRLPRGLPVQPDGQNPGVAVGGLQGVQYRPGQANGGADELRRAVEQAVQRDLGGPRVFPAPGARAADQNEEILADEAEV